MIMDVSLLFLPYEFNTILLELVEVIHLKREESYTYIYMLISMTYYVLVNVIVKYFFPIRKWLASMAQLHAF